MDIVRPGGELSTRPLHFIWIADCSTSMKFGGKMEALNKAIRDSIPHMVKISEENPNAEVLVRAISFSTKAKWHVKEPTRIDEFEWEDLEAKGVTDMGDAFELLSEELKMPPMSDRALPPVLVLITDGQPTDEYKEKLEKLLKLPWGTKAVRLGIAIGRATNKRVLEEFINNDEIKVLSADNALDLTNYIRWVSTVVLKAASSPASQSMEQGDITSNVIIPDMPDEFWNEDVSVGDVW